MRGLMLCVFALAMLTASADEDDQEEEQREEEGPLQCFRCDLGFWDACYTTKTNCNIGERCYTGRGKAGDVLDVKLLGCVKVKECELVTSVEIFSNTTIYVMTKHCCDTHLCNTGHTLPLNTLLSLALTTITIIHLSFPRQ